MEVVAESEFRFINISLLSTYTILILKKRGSGARRTSALPAHKLTKGGLASTNRLGRSNKVDYMHLSQRCDTTM